MVRKAFVSVGDFCPDEDCRDYGKREIGQVKNIKKSRTGLEIAHVLHTSIPTVQRTRRRFVEEGLEASLNERPRPGGQREPDGRSTTDTTD
jgi:hypothetical protein